MTRLLIRDGYVLSMEYRAGARADAIVRAARLRSTKAIPVLNLGVPA
jgi:hypothetical protein